jgi:hypothetical protein
MAETGRHFDANATIAPGRVLTDDTQFGNLQLALVVAVGAGVG